MITMRVTTIAGDGRWSSLLVRTVVLLGPSGLYTQEREVLQPMRTIIGAVTGIAGWWLLFAVNCRIGLGVLLIVMSACDDRHAS
jgi:hypothetical protein